MTYIMEEIYSVLWQKPLYQQLIQKKQNENT